MAQSNGLIRIDEEGNEQVNIVVWIFQLIQITLLAYGVYSVILELQDEGVIGPVLVHEEDYIKWCIRGYSEFCPEGVSVSFVKKARR